jgi:hypothetical protein
LYKFREKGLFLGGGAKCDFVGGTRGDCVVSHPSLYVKKGPEGNKLLGFLRRSSREIRNSVRRRCLYLTVVRPHLRYATQICAPQTIELIKRVERVQRRATKFILNLPFYSEVPYEERLIASNLLPISFWHEYLDLVHFFKMINDLIYAKKDIQILAMKGKREQQAIQILPCSVLRNARL